MVEYWSGPSTSYSFPRNVLFEQKLDTDLYEFVKVISYLDLWLNTSAPSHPQHKAVPLTLSFSPDGKTFAVMASDRKVNRHNLPKFHKGHCCRFDSSIS